MKKIFSFFWEIAKTVIIALLIVVPIRYFLFQPFFVKGQSMEPNFENGDYLIVDEISYRFREPERGEVLVFKYPEDPTQRYIKRVVGLPGETVEIKDGKVMITNEQGTQALDESSYLSSDIQTIGDIKVIVGQDEYFVLGDNRYASYDSRRWGLLPKDDIIGRVFARPWPLTDSVKIETPNY